MRRARLLRGGAVLIALLALVDPELARRGPVDAEVAVVRAPTPPGEGGAALEALTQDVARAVGTRFRAVSGPWTGAAATVLVGEGFPPGAEGLPDPVFRVVPSDALTRPHLVRIDGPGSIAHPGRARFRVTLGPAEPAPAPAPPTLLLLSEGVEVSRATARPRGALLEADLDFIPPGPGVHRLEVVLAGPRSEEHRPLAYPVAHVVAEPWSVLFLDPRPAWGSTFVRRVLGDDPRFDVAGRVETAPGVFTTFGSPPATPADASALAPYDLVIVGAAELLARPLGATLEGWVRSGGTLLLLPDEAPTDGVGRLPWEELAGAAEWIVEERAEPLAVALQGVPGLEAAAGPALRSRVVSVPRTPPPRIRSWAVDAEGRPLLWSRPLGQGRVIVSGAHDAWQFRADEGSAFAPTWQAVAAQAAALRLPPVELHLSPGTPPGGGVAVAPGAQLDLTAVARPEVTTRRAEARLESPSGVPLPFALWPTLSEGVFGATLRAPDAPGTAWIEVEIDGERARLPLVVDPRVRQADPGADPALLRLWSHLRGGALFTADETDALVAALETALARERHPEPWHPMRSPWWIVPFALLLAGEWWLRRRAGLA